jgi:hypothetical protein
LRAATREFYYNIGPGCVAEHYTSIAKPNPSATAVAFVTDESNGANIQVDEREMMR